MTNFNRKFKVFLSIFLLSPLLVIDAAGAQLLPFTQFDIDQINRSQNFRDPQEQQQLRCGGGNNTPSAQNNKVFFIGDSLTFGMTVGGNLLNQASESGFDVDVNYNRIDAPNGWNAGKKVRVTNRSVEATGGYNIRQTMKTLQEHPEDIKNAGIVVVSMGTNRDMNAVVEMNGLVDYIREQNAGAQIYWVNTYFRPSSNAYQEVNNDIQASANQKGFTIIDFATAAKADPERFKLASDQVHHSYEIYKNKAAFILEELPGSSTSSTTTASAVTSQNTTLTEDQKIAQNLILGFTGEQSDEMIAIVTKYKIGGVFILGSNTEVYTDSFFEQLNRQAGTSLLVMSDEEGGRIQRFKNQIGAFPSARELGTKTNEEVRLVGKEIGEKLRTRGVNVNLAPVVDVDDPVSGAIHDKDRAFSSDPAVVAEKAGAFSTGLQEAGVAPVFKHFPGLGTTPGDTDESEETSPSLDQLRQRDLKAYEPLINKFNAMVMLNNAEVPGLTEAGVRAVYSPAAVSLLRSDFGFSGLIVTDALNAGGVTIPIQEAVARSLQAGVNLPLFSYVSDQELQSIIAVVRESGYNPDDNLQKIANYKDGIGLTNVTGPSCGRSGGTGNGEKDAMDYLINELGYTPQQAAGLVANFHHESGINPIRMQSVFAKNSRNGGVDPSLLEEDGGVRAANVNLVGDQLVANGVFNSKGSIGWGLVQWTPFSKYVDLVKEAGIVDDELEGLFFQLDFVDGQLRADEGLTINGDPRGGVESPGGKLGREGLPDRRATGPLSESRTAQQAAAAFAIGYERCAKCQEGNPEVIARGNDAVDVLTRYGSL